MTSDGYPSSGAQVPRHEVAPFFFSPIRLTDRFCPAQPSSARPLDSLTALVFVSLLRTIHNNNTIFSFMSLLGHPSPTVVCACRSAVSYRPLPPAVTLAITDPPSTPSTPLLLVDLLAFTLRTNAIHQLCCKAKSCAAGSKCRAVDHPPLARPAVRPSLLARGDVLLLPPPLPHTALGCAQGRSWW